MNRSGCIELKFMCFCGELGLLNNPTIQIWINIKERSRTQSLYNRGLIIFNWIDHIFTNVYPFVWDGMATWTQMDSKLYYMNLKCKFVLYKYSKTCGLLSILCYFQIFDEIFLPECCYNSDTSTTNYNYKFTENAALIIAFFYSRTFSNISTEELRWMKARNSPDF